MTPVLGIGADFTRVTAVTPDGTEYTAEVKRGDVIDVEAEECRVLRSASDASAADKKRHR